MMIDKKILDALSSSVYMAKQNALKLTDDDERIKTSVFYPDWAEGKHEVGEIYNANGQTWECFQAYDNEIYPDITPENEAWFTFNRPLHGKSPQTARPFVKPMGAHDMYHMGEYIMWTDGEIYVCLSDTAYSPEEYKEAWKIYENS